MYRIYKKHEHYTEKARKEGYPARSVYKLKEIDEKFKIFKKGDKVLDLGCSPGSWLLYAANKVGERGKVVGIDIEKVNILLKNNIVFIQKDILALEESDLNEKYDVVISDLAPATSGVKLIDSGRSFELSEKAFEIAKKFLLPGGNFVCKIFESEDANKFLKEVEKKFKLVKKFRPKAVIKESKEFYIVGKYFLG